MFLPQRVTLLYDLFMVLPQWVTFYITCLCFCHSGVRSKLIFYVSNSLGYVLN